MTLPEPLLVALANLRMWNRHRGVDDRLRRRDVRRLRRWLARNP